MRNSPGSGQIFLQFTFLFQPPRWNLELEHLEAVAEFTIIPLFCVCIDISSYSFTIITDL